ncbi:hypothetical protein AURDEDRAFT_140854, partial [Auricularia subglabra TFB-10046 SS5]
MDEDDEDEEVDEDGFPLVQNPSEDIRRDLEDALDHVDFQGSFYFSRTYDDAPNPILRLAELDLIGLPLSQRDAAAIIGKSEQAPFGKGERTVVDKEVRDTWQMDAQKVIFSNSAWPAFLERVVCDVCEALGVNREASKPRCELYKLLLYETGSHFLPHVDTEKANNMFATIVVVLPSVFTGGDAHLSHAGRTAVLNSSEPSLSKTTVLAWYTDVMHEIKPITSGYRLALSFNLVHTTTALRPSLSDNAGPVSRLRHVLLSWKQEQGDVDRIVYKLDHDYSHANLSASALKGSDAHVLAALDEAAKELGFCLGLGTLEHTIRGSAEGDYGGYGDCDVTMGEIQEKTTSIDSLFDLDGRLIAKDVDFDAELDTIPMDLVDSLEGEEWDDEEYEGYQGNYAGDIERFYRRSVLVIWPPWGGPCRGGDRRAAYALERLARANGASPTAEEEQFFNFVLQSGQTDKLPVLCKLAKQWSRGDLWQSAILRLGGDTKPAHERFAPVAACGFEVTKSSIESFVRRCSSNTKRLEMLTMLEAWASGQEPSSLQQDVSCFVQEHTSWLLRKLQPPNEREKQLITDAGIAHGGVLFLDTTILPQIKALTSYQYCDAYAQYLHENAQRIAPAAEDAEVLQRIIKDLLTSVVERAELFPNAGLVQAPYAGYGQPANVPRPKPAPEVAFKLIAECLDYGHVPLAVRVIERMLDQPDLPAATTTSRALSVLLPLTPLLENDLNGRSPRPELPLAKLCETAVRLMLDSEVAKQGQLTKDDVDGLLSAIVLGGNVDLLTSLFIPKLKDMPWNAASWKSFIDLLATRRTEPVFAAAETHLNAVLVEMATTYAQKVDLPSTNQPATYSGYYGSSSIHSTPTGAAKIRDALDVCIRAGGIGCAKIVLDRVLEARNLTSVMFVSDVLIPLVANMATLAKEQHLALSADPFAPAIRKIMRAWLDKVLGLNPDITRVQPLLNRLKNFTCVCAECKRVRDFLTKGHDRELRLERVGAPKRKHVEQYLSSWAQGMATFDTLRTSPQGLKVVKTDAVLAPLQWKANQTVGLRTLKTLGNEPELRAILGDQYTAIVGQLNGLAVPQPTSAPSASGARSTGSAAVGSSSHRPAPGATSSRPQAVQRPAQGGSSSSTHSTRPGPAAPVTPAKRKADTVIDLCTP